MSRTKQRSLKMNFLMNAILSLSSVLFPLITFPYVSRILSPTGTGRVSFAVSLISYFNMLAQLGIPIYGIRACASVRDDKEELSRTAHELLFINLVMALFSYACLAILLASVDRLYEDRPLYVLVSMTIVLTAIGMEWLYKALEQYAYITVRSLVFKGIALIAMFLLIHKESDYVRYGAVSILAASASAIFNFINARRYIEWRYLGGYAIKKHIRAIMCFFGMACATTIYTNLDTVMLGFMKSDIDVGYYHAAIKIKSILVMVVTSLGAVLLPRASYFIEKGELEAFRRISKKALGFVLIASVPMTIYFICFAGECILFVSGHAYLGAVLPMQIIMPTLLFIGVSNLLGVQMLIPLGREKDVLVAELAGAVVDLVLNVICIPRFSAAGAAIGTTMAELVVMSVIIQKLRKRYTGLAERKREWRIILAVLAASVSVTFAKGLQIPVLFKLVISAGMYFGIYLLVLFLLREELIRDLVCGPIGQLRQMVRDKER